jgi:uncharacterized RDD family membrane protein YckC
MAEADIRVPSGLTTDGLLGKRYLARFVDSLAILALLFVLALVVMVILAPSRERTFNSSLTFLPIVLVVWIGYGTILESSKWQATLGKRLFGLRVYNPEGGRLATMQAVSRNLVKDGPFIVFASITGVGQFLTLGWLCVHLLVMHRSAVNQAIHDRAAHSWVAAAEETTQLHLA